MIHAKENDYDVVKEIFSEHKQWFPHVRQDYIKRMIASGNLILDNDVIITYNYYKRKQRIGTITAQQGDRNGSASQALQDFFKWTNRRVFLSVRNDNLIAKKFYEKNGMDLVGFTSWSKGGVKDALPGDVYMYDNVKEVL
jgi:RimJ/RimL family protein N-acetyltransferase